MRQYKYACATSHKLKNSLTIKVRPRPHLDPEGEPLKKWTLHTRFDNARAAAAERAKNNGNDYLAGRIREFQFRDIRPKAASEIASLTDASKLLGHTEEEITRQVYRRVGEKVKPTR